MIKHLTFINKNSEFKKIFLSSFTKSNKIYYISLYINHTSIIDVNGKSSSPINNCNRSTTILISSQYYNKVAKRTMHRATNAIHYTGNLLTPYSRKISINMSTKTAFKLKKKAAKDLANDGTGKHMHVIEQTCVQIDCEAKQCKTLCNTLYEVNPKGHNTHKPPIGRFCRFISETDTNGHTQAQYFVSANDNKTKTAIEITSYGTDLKPDLKQQTYIDQHRDIYDKN